MGKLIELLNEYEPYIKNDGTPTDNFWWYVSQGHSAVFPKEVGVERIISKQYGFIKWLVDNDKIDRNKIYWLDIGYKIDEIGIGERKNTVDIDLSNKLLMLLSIQDEPIEFLISILK